MQQLIDSAVTTHRSSWGWCRMLTCAGFVSLATAAPGLASVAGQAGTIKVESLSFEGNAAFSDRDLSRVMVTRATGFLPWSRAQLFEQAVFQADLERLRAYYADGGFPDARVVDVGVEFSANGAAVDLTVHIEEGEPIVVEAIEFVGLDGLPAGSLERMRAIPLEAGRPLNQRQLLESREHAILVLRDSGYPEPRVNAIQRDGSSERQVVMVFEAEPGEAAVFGAIAVQGARKVSDAVIRRTLAFQPGQTYRVSRMLESQRRLFGLGLFEFAHVDEASDERPANDTVTSGDAASVPMIVTVVEGRATSLGLGVGYGSEEGPRGSLDWRHRNFLGAARQLGAEGRYSGRLRGTSVEFVQPYVGSGAVTFDLKTGAWWADEPSHSSRSLGGQAGVTYRRTIERGLNRVPVENVLRISYVHEFLQHAIKPEVLDDLRALDELIPLGIDPVSGSERGRLTALEITGARSSIENPLDPHAGYAVTLRAEHAAPWLGGTYRYDEFHADTRAFVPFGDRAVWASRLQAGAIVASSDEDVPFSARYFLGGSSTLRGWGRFEVAPLTSDGLPIGGRAVLALTTELRVWLTDSFSLVAFVDAGNVWPDVSAADLGDLRVAAGPGLRWTSGVGVIRADLGVQVNPIPDLLVDGQPQRRRWRFHLSFGHAF
jgi:outer membrane protein insertion porin family